MAGRLVNATFLCLSKFCTMYLCYIFQKHIEKRGRERGKKKKIFYLFIAFKI